MALAKVERELHERALVAAAVEPDAVAALGAAVVVAEHQLGAVDAVVEVPAEHVRRPDDRHAVGQDERGAPERLAHLGIVVADRQGVHRHGAHVTALAALDHGVHRVDRLAVVGRARPGVPRMSRVGISAAAEAGPDTPCGCGSTRVIQAVGEV